MKTNSRVGLFAICFSLLCSACGQGTFLFQNLGFGVDAPVFDAQGIPLAGPDYLAELYGGLTVDSLAPATPRTMVPFYGGTFAGYFQAPHYVLIAGVPGGAMAWVQVRAWDARLGATYEETVARGIGGYGQSVSLHLTSGNLNVPTVPASLIGLQSFSLRAVIP